MGPWAEVSGNVLVAVGLEGARSSILGAVDPCIKPRPQLPEKKQ